MEYIGDMGVKGEYTWIYCITDNVKLAQFVAMWIRGICPLDTKKLGVPYLIFASNEDM